MKYIKIKIITNIKKTEEQLKINVKKDIRDWADTFKLLSPMGKRKRNKA